MKLVKTKEDGLKDNYLELHYDKVDSETNAVLLRLKSTLKYVEGSSDGTRVTIPLTDIYYIETVDRKTFAYTKDMSIDINETLRDIIDNYSDAGFVRISKSSVVNLYKIQKLQGDLNMRVIIYLKNSEKLIMNRSYRAEFYEKLNKLQGRKKHEDNR